MPAGGADGGACTEVSKTATSCMPNFYVWFACLEADALNSDEGRLEKLEYKDVYHMTSILTQNPRDADLWKRAYDAVYGGKGT
jgi:hypothetical protein